MNQILYIVYFMLADCGIVKSSNDFSRRLLGRSSRYYSWILATNHKPAIDVMVGLFVRLEGLCNEAKSIGDEDKELLFDDLATKLWAEIRIESLAKKPVSRKKHRHENDAGDGVDMVENGNATVPAHAEPFGA